MKDFVQVEEHLIQIITRIDFIGSYILIGVSVSYFVKCLNDMHIFLLNQQKEEKLKTFHLKSMLMLTEKIAHIGSWVYIKSHRHMKFSTEAYRILAMDPGSHIDFKLLLKFFNEKNRKIIIKKIRHLYLYNSGIDEEFEIFIPAYGYKWVRIIVDKNTENSDDFSEVKGSIIDITDQKKSELAKDRFLSTVSHEMRTSLTAMIGFADSLIESISDKEQRMKASLIANGGRSLHAIINDILDASRLNNGKLSLQEKPTLLSEVYDEIVALLTPSAKDKNLDFQTDISSMPQQVLCDPIRFRQICFNILGNAIKFTDKGIVKFSVEEKIEKNQNHIFLTFQDSGMGVNKEFIPHLFKPFEQDISNDKFAMGSGLGLSICKDIVDLMGGSINVESSVGKGTKFYVNLSFSVCCQDNLLKESNITPYFMQGLRVVYVDDNSVNHMLLQDVLVELGCYVTSLFDGQQAVEKACYSRESFDVVIMDIQMPKMNGLEAVEKIRSYEKSQMLCHKPIIAFSASAFQSEIEHALSLGFDDYITKPFQKSDFIKSIARFF